MVAKNRAPQDLPRWLWLWTPLFLYFLHYAAWALLSPVTYNRWFPSETGITENLTVVVAAIAMLLGGLIVYNALQAGQRWLVWRCGFRYLLWVVCILVVKRPVGGSNGFIGKLRKPGRNSIIRVRATFIIPMGHWGHCWINCRAIY